MSVFDEEATNPAEIDRTEEIREVEIENPATVAVIAGIGHDGSIALESMRDLVFPAVRRVKLGNAILKQIGQVTLEQLEVIRWRLDQSGAVGSLGKCE